MIETFIVSWPLFHLTYLAGWLIAVLLALLGVWVVARDQIFMGAAVAEASTLGIALGLSWGISSEHTLGLLAVLFSMAASLLGSRGGQKGRASHESLTGWIFLFSAALALLLVSHSPHGLEEVHRLLSSSIIGATMGDVMIFSLLLVVSGLAVVALERRILLFMLDPEMAAALGMKIKRWSFVSSLWLGVTIGLALRVSGMLYTFGCLVLPALAAKAMCREVRQLFWVAPAIALAASIFSFVWANGADFPPAPATVVILGIAAGVTAAVRGFMAKRRQ